MNRVSQFVLLLCFVTLVAGLAPLQAAAQGQPQTIEIFDNVEYFMGDTSSVYIQRQEAILARARVDLMEHGWRRLLPTVQLTFNARSQNYVFIPVSTSGSLVDPALRQWPADTWTLTAAWRLNTLIDPSPKRRAKAGVRAAQWNLEVARHQQRIALLRAQSRAGRERRERLRQIEELTLRVRHLDQQRALLEQQLQVRADLVQLAEIKYRQGELSYEGFATQRLALLGLEAEMAEIEHGREQATLHLDRLQTEVAGIVPPHNTSGRTTTTGRTANEQQGTQCPDHSEPTGRTDYSEQSERTTGHAVPGPNP